MADELNPYIGHVIAIVGKNGIPNVEAESMEKVWDVVINLGRRDGVALGHKFVIFALGDELTDPSSKKSLGRYEIVRGEATVRHLQEGMCTLRSAMTVRQLRATAYNALLQNVTGTHRDGEYEYVAAPLNFVAKGDLVRRI
jgi:hypothetical protein